jgi:hypothetical protein
MTTAQFEKRLQKLGASEREAELICASYFDGYWMDAFPTRLTLEQEANMLSLLGLRREEDQEQALIANGHINRTHAAGYIVRGIRFSEASR